MKQSRSAKHYGTLRRIIVGVLTTITFVAMVLSCSEEKTIVPSSESTSYADVKYIFDLKCATARCHSGDNPDAGLGLESYEKILAGSTRGPVVVPGKADASLLYRTMAWTSPPVMPIVEKLPDYMTKSVGKWIDDGLIEGR
jgi:hypothetical protein